MKIAAESLQLQLNIDVVSNNSESIRTRIRDNKSNLGVLEFSQDSRYV